MLLQYYHIVRKHIWLEQSALKPSADWLSMSDCLNLIDWRSPATILLVFYKQMLLKYKSYIAGRDAKSQMLWIRITPMVSSVLWRSLYPLLFIVSSWLGLKWCPNVAIIFLIYLSIHISIIKHLKQNKWLDKWWTSHQCCLLLRLYCMMLLAFNVPSSDYSAKRLVSFACKTTRIVVQLLQLI